jgi:D-sedoheptulose 7-phosphate isomerase
MKKSFMSLLTSRLEEIGNGFLAAARSDYPGQISAAAAAIADSLARGGKLLVFGNGGSAADAQHLCGELIVQFQTKRRALPAIALVTDSTVLTACANDVSFDSVFARQVEALGVKGDVALGISTSGNSPNVIRALQVAGDRGLFRILLGGPTGGKAAEHCDLLVAAPGSNTARIQELHVAAYHLICELLDARFTA